MVTQVGSTEEFDKALSSNSLVVVDFYATWCGPCVNFAPKFDELSKEYPNLKFLKVDVDGVPELQSKFGITSIPSFKVFKDGNLVGEVVGANEANLSQLIYLSNPEVPVDHPRYFSTRKNVNVNPEEQTSSGTWKRSTGIRGEVNRRSCLQDEWNSSCNLRNAIEKYV